ncbi:MAG: capsular biosynthesis protein [Cellvibrionales bacterium]|nr:capsular biosynthesis protein [Cellvibrionales bacterium]
MNVLLLQGPLGNFFTHLTSALQAEGHQVFRIHFNAGDRYYSRDAKARDYTGTLENWPIFLAHFIKKHQIDTLVLYGDCRPYHKLAIKLAKQAQIQYQVLEEGYLRPDWVTCESQGANANSSFQFHPNLYPHGLEISEDEKADRTGNTFFQRFWFAFSYFVIMRFGCQDFPHYTHHIPASPVLQGKWWLTNFYRKYLYKIYDRLSFRSIQKQQGKPCFLVPLQVATDAQIREHSCFPSMEDFLTHILSSFKQHAEPEAMLIIKHHPVDRGHSHYGQFIRKTINQFDIKQPVIYGHDWPIPKLLRQVDGVITLNSTVGISALIHKLPVKVMGNAFWDLPHITDQQPLDDFWQKPTKPNSLFVDRFIYAIANETQIKGSFYKKNTATAKALAKKIQGKDNLTNTETTGFTLSKG